MKRCILCGLVGLALGLGAGVPIGAFSAERNAFHQRFLEEQRTVAPILASDPAFVGLRLDEEYTGHSHLSGQISPSGHARLAQELFRALGQKRANDMMDALQITP